MIYVFICYRRMPLTIVHVLSIMTMLPWITSKPLPPLQPVIVKDALVCHTGRVIQHFKLSSSRSCQMPRAATTQTCIGKVYDPTVQHVPIRGYACSLTQSSYVSHFYFWGEKFVDKSPAMMQAPTPEQCLSMIAEKQVPGIGTLSQHGPKMWATQNVDEVEYAWLRTRQGVTVNAYLQEVTLYYNVLTGKMVTDLVKTTECEVKDNFCKTSTMTLLWQHNREDLCAYLQRSEVYGGRLEVHFDADDKLMKIDIPQLTMQFEDFVRVEKEIEDCFPDLKLVRTLSNFIIATTNCEWSGNNITFAPPAGSDDPDVTATQLNFMMDTFTRMIGNLERKLNFANCRSNNEIQFIYGLLAKVFPSRVLAHLTKRKTAAVIMGDVISELSCVKKDVHVVPSLRYEEKLYATRPLGALDINGTATLVQWTPGEFWSTEIRFFQKQELQASVSFHVSNYTLTYNGPTLVAKPMSLIQLRHDFAKIGQNIPDFDFTTARTNLHKYGRGEAFLDLQASIAELSFQQEVINEQKSGANFEASANMAIHNSAVTPYANVTNPALIVLITILNILGHLWSVFWTGCVIFVVYRYVCRPNRVNTYQRPNRNNLEAEVGRAETAV